MSNLEKENLGEITIEDDVIFSIIQKTVLEVEGVFALTSGFTDKVFAKWRGSKGIKISREENGDLKVAISISVHYGHRLLELASLVQKLVKENLTMMTELEVISIDVHIQTIIFPKENLEEIGEKNEESR